MTPRSPRLLLALPLLAACGSTPLVATAACATSVGEYCGARPAAVCAWPGPTPSPADCARTLRSTACGDYEAVLLQGVDTGTYRYYARATGALVAVIDYSAVFGRRTCEAGPSDGFAEPACQPSSFVSTCPDGGT